MVQMSDIIESTSQYGDDHCFDNMTVVNIINHNELQFFTIVFGEPHYDLTEATFTTSFFPFMQLLVYSSRQILDIIREYEDYQGSPEFFIWTFLYQFIFDYYIAKYHAPYPSLPALNKIYYLKTK